MQQDVNKTQKILLEMKKEQRYLGNVFTESWNFSLVAQPDRSGSHEK